MLSVKRHIDRIIIPLSHFCHNMCRLIVRRIVRIIPSGSGNLFHIKYIFVITQDLPKSILFIVRVKIHTIITQLFISIIVTAYNDTRRTAHPVAFGWRTDLRQIKLCGEFIPILLWDRKHTAAYICHTSVGNAWCRYFHRTRFIGNHLQRIISTICFYSRQFKICSFGSNNIHTGYGAQHLYPGDFLHFGGWQSGRKFIFAIHREIGN